MREVVIVEAVRTAVGKRNGGLAGQHAADAVHAMQQLVDAMQQHQYADREPENEFACIVCHLRASQLRRRESAALTPM